MSYPPTRRTFLGASVATVAAAPRLSAAANDRIVVGVMGTGGLGTGPLPDPVAGRWVAEFTPTGIRRWGVPIVVGFDTRHYRVSRRERLAG